MRSVRTSTQNASTIPSPNYRASARSRRATSSTGSSIPTPEDREANLTDLGMIHVPLLTTLHAAENYMTDASYATAMVYRKNGVNLKATDSTVTVTNRITSQSFDAGWKGTVPSSIGNGCPSTASNSTPSSSSGSAS